MAATTGYQAGFETNGTQISYGFETAWGTPTGTFKAIRYTSDSLTKTKTRQRPTEISVTREAQQGVTTQEVAGGSINYALSWQTFDDFFSAVLQQDLAAAVTIQAIAADITITNTAGVITISSTLAGKFTPLAQGQWVRILGAANATNNDWWYISVKDSQVLMHLTGRNSATAVTETASAGNIGIRGGSNANGTTFKSMTIQQQLAPSNFLVYAGAYVTRLTLQGGIGNFMSGTIDIVAQSETKNLTTNGASGAPVTAAPTGRVFDPISGFVALLWNEAPPTSKIDQFSITLENQSAAGEFCLGSNQAAGVLGGTFMASASFRAYFKDYTQYDLFSAETSGRLAIILKDFAGGSYAITFPNAILLGKITAGGPGQPIYAEFDVEAGPSSTGTVVFDRMAGV